MSISDRWFNYGGRILSAENLVGAITLPTKKQKTQNTTGPFDENPVNRRTGFTDYDNLSFKVWADLNYRVLLAQLASTETDERVAMWGHSGDTDLTEFEACLCQKVEYKQATPEAALIETEVMLTLRDSGLEFGVLNHATAAETGDGDTEGTPDNNGTMGSAATVATSSVANPSVITTSAAHGFLTGDTVLIAGHSGSTPSINASHVVTRISDTTFSIPVNVTVGGTGGTATRTSTREGGALWVQLMGLDLDGGDDFTVTGRDSPDGATWADLVSATFDDEYDAADADDGTATRVAITGSIDRYTAVAWEYGGSPGGNEAATFQAGISRTETS